MRHTAITRLAETGADIKTLQEFSGHESIAMVLRYAHAQDQAVDSALDLMENRGTIWNKLVKKTVRRNCTGITLSADRGLSTAPSIPT